MSSRKVKAKLGRPTVIAADVQAGMRLPAPLVEAIDRWADDNGVSRSEAMRRLIELGLQAKGKRKR